MRKIILLIFIILCSTIGYSPGYASDLSDTFSEKYNSLVPTENTSVRSDYLFEQIALGSEYTIKMLGRVNDQMNDQNSEINEKIDVLINKFDTLIEQNKQIIKLLERKN